MTAPTPRPASGAFLIDYSAPLDEYRAALAEAHRLELAELPAALAFGGELVPVAACEPLRREP